MTWAVTRKATEPEDHAYCLLGILNVQIPLTYGEGKEKALSRLQKEVQHSTITPSIIPFSRNERFVGRQSQLAKVEAMLSAGEGNTKIAMVGEGGTGKSQVALEIAYRVMEKDNACSVFWVDASDMDGIQQAYAGIVQKLKLPGWEDDEADAIKTVKLHLGGSFATRWLLIFDNVDSLAYGDAQPITSQSSSLINCLPQSTFGSIIFTTTNHDVAQFLAPHNIVELHQMAPSIAQELFENHLITSVSTNERQEIKLLLEKLSYLPLAIALAAAYININKIKVKDYLLLSTAQSLDAFQINSKALEDKLPEDTIPSAVMITLLISINQIHDNHLLATEFLSLMAFVDRKDILLEFLRPTWSQESEEAIRLLHDYAIVTRRPAVSAIDLHRLVHLAVRKWIVKNGPLEEWTRRTIQHLQEVFPWTHHANRSKWRRLLPHATCALSYSPVDQDGDYDDDRTDLIWRCALSLDEDGRYKEAEELYVQVMEIRKRVFGLDCLGTLVCMGNLATVYRDQGRLEEAEELGAQVVETRKRVFGLDNLDTLISMNNLALTYRDQGRLEEAEGLGAQVIETSKKVLGAGHPSTLMSTHNIAVTWKEQGRDEEAMRLMEECYSSRVRVLGVHHPNTVVSGEKLAEWRTEATEFS